MVSQCTCPSQFPMVKVSDGKYKIGDSQTLIFVRVSLTDLFIYFFFFNGETLLYLPFSTMILPS